MNKISQSLFRTLTACILIILSLTACTGKLASTPTPRKAPTDSPQPTLILTIPVVEEPYYTFTKGQILLAQGKLDIAIQEFEKALTYDPNYEDAYIYRGHAYYQKGEYDHAMADYEKALQMCSINCVAIYNYRGLVYADQGDLDSAIEEYDKAIDLRPWDTETLINRGKAYLAKGDIDRAIADYDKAIQGNPSKEPNAYLIRGQAYMKKGDEEKAIADFRKVLDLSDDLDLQQSVQELLLQLGVNPLVIPTKTEIIMRECMIVVLYPVMTWEDLDLDGIYDESEPPLPDVHVHLEYTQIGNYGSSPQVTDATGSAMLTFGNFCDNNDPNMNLDFSIEVTADAPPSCKFSTPDKLSKTNSPKPYMFESHSMSAYLFGFYCGREPSPTSTVLAPTGTP